MILVDKFWTCVTYLVQYLSFSSFNGVNDQSVLSFDDPFPDAHYSYGGPIFKPPGGDFADDFKCDYSAMTGWSSCFEGNTTCWLINKSTGARFDIGTNYESVMPTGVVRQYTMDVVDGKVNADGIVFPFAKLFDGVYPGPWIQACWGDTLNITVHNKLSHNGTSVHWHGVRQLNRTQADGVNGITQCPIAPKDTYVYTYNVTQYGSSWYHSHYSVQYADGTAGPMTFHGPSSAQYDEAVQPIMMSDWGHNSAFEVITSDIPLQQNDILLNGIGNVTRYNNSVVNTAPIPPPYTIFFEPPSGGVGRKYLLRIINIAFDASFYFSIDNHTLTVVTTDFVPIKPYKADSIIVGIGQRYNVIVEALPTDNSGKPTGSLGPFWIRTRRADCFRFNQTKDTSPGYQNTGIVRYKPGTDLPTKASVEHPVDVTDCTDEPYNSLVPVVPWTVPSPANGNPFGENITLQSNNNLNWTFFPVAFFSLSGEQVNPIKVDYGNPVFLNLNNSGPWSPSLNVFPEDYKPLPNGSPQWVYLFIKGTGDGSNTIGAHPIHLHGHDFAILAQSNQTVEKNPPKLKLNNPPRRDVVLLPSSGYVIIAFQADNPGAWLVHCHIADHISAGLGLQIMERREDAQAIWPSLAQSKAIRDVTAGCVKWNAWWSNCTNWWPGNGKNCPIGLDNAFPDSGV